MAITVGESDSICQILDVNITNDQGDTPLHVMVAGIRTNPFGFCTSSEPTQKADDKDIQNIKSLLKFHPDVNIKNAEGYISLQLALKNKRSDELVKVLLDYEGDCDYNFQDTDGCTALYHAVSPISSQHDGGISSGFTSFNFKFRDDSIVKQLIEKGGKVDIAAKNGYNPLLLALVFQREDIMKVMLKKKTSFSQSGLEQTITQFFVKAEYNKRTKKGTNERISTIYPGKEYYGMTPLLIAVYDNNKEMAEMLLQAGANVNAAIKNEDNRSFLKMTPLLVSLNKYNLEMVQLLINAGANLNVVNGKGNNALHMNIEMYYLHVMFLPDDSIHQKPSIAKLLIESGIDLNAKGKSGETALHLAVKLEIQDIVDYILEKGMATL